LRTHRYEHLANRRKEAQAWRGSRVVVPDLPHHVTQRGNRREPVFSRPTTIASIGDWSLRQRGALVPPSGLIA